MNGVPYFHTNPCIEGVNPETSWGDVNAENHPLQIYAKS